MRISDWSSDVCSSDLARHRDPRRRRSLSGAARHSNARTATLSSTGSEGGCAEASTGPITGVAAGSGVGTRSEEHTSELQSLMRISYAVFCLKKNNSTTEHKYQTTYKKQLTT